MDWLSGWPAWSGLDRELAILGPAALRLAVAFAAGSIMGLERERNLHESFPGQPVVGAGFRTYTLVCVGACIYAIASIYGFQALGNVSDPGRVAAQVVTGIGFLGAGTILRDRKGIRGLTTAAGLWAAAGIGLLIGAGLFLTGLLAALSTYLVLALHRLFPTWRRRWRAAGGERGRGEAPSA